MSNRIGICLSGGGARGIAHIGVLQALEENGISPHFISGASAGSIVGALYAAGKTPQEILTIFKESSLLKLFKVSLPTVGFTDNSYIIEMLEEYVSEDDFASLNKKLFISVTNFTRGQNEIIEEGQLFKIVAASSSIPILFKPLEINGEVYVDGGLLNNLPVEPLEQHAKHIIGVNVTPIDYASDLSSLIEIGYRTLGLVMWTNVAPRLSACDVVIEPPADDYGFFEISKADEIYEAGYEATMAKMPELLRLTSGQRIQTESHRSRFVKEKTTVGGESAEEPVGFWDTLLYKIRTFFQRLFGN